MAVVSGPGSLERILGDASPQTGRVDGLIIVDMDVPEKAGGELARSGAVVVTMGRALPAFSSIMIDDVEVGRSAADHLLALGHEVIGLIYSQPNGPYAFEVSNRRRAGYLLALAASAVEHQPGLEALGNSSVVGGFDAATHLLTAEPGLTALFCMTDQMAIGAVRAARALGRRVPEDVSVVGVDDHEVSAAVGLTTIRQDVAALGARAAELLLDGLEGRPSIVHETIPTSLVVRQTTRRR
jgi:DNA-binding LacI/PurR family transcriptional regulator